MRAGPVGPAHKDRTVEATVAFNVLREGHAMTRFDDLSCESEGKRRKDQRS